MGVTCQLVFGGLKLNDCLWNFFFDNEFNFDPQV